MHGKALPLSPPTYDVIYEYIFQLVRKQIQNQCKEYGYVPKVASGRMESGSRRRRIQRRKRLSTTDGYVDDADSGSEFEDINQGIEK